MIADWILEENLHAFLDVVAGFAGYPIDDLDRDAIDAQLVPADESECTASYDFGQTVSLRLAKEHGASAIDVRIQGPDRVEALTQGAIAALQLVPLRADRV